MWDTKDFYTFEVLLLLLPKLLVSYQLNNTTLAAIFCMQSSPCLMDLSTCMEENQFRADE